MESQKSRAGNIIDYPVSDELIDRLKVSQSQLGENFPKFAVMVISYNAANTIERTIQRIPQRLGGLIQEIFLLDDCSGDDTFNIASNRFKDSSWGDKLTLYKNVNNLGYGGNQKKGYRYAISKGHDYVIMIHGDGQYAPEYIPELMWTAINKEADIVFGSRMINLSDAIKGGMPKYKLVANKGLTFFENMILGTKLTEFHSGLRMYSTKYLRSIPFEENTDDFHFDTEIIVQARALNYQIEEIPIKAFYGPEVCNVNGFQYAMDISRSVLAYRLHQLHFIRLPKYFFKKKYFGRRKKGAYGAHHQILKLIPRDSVVLEFSFEQSLLEEDFKRLNIVSKLVSLSESQDHDSLHYIEDYKSLNIEGRFDYLILTDIVARVRDPQKMFEHLEKYLNNNGKIIFTVPNIAIWFYRISLLLGRFNYGTKGILDRTHVRFYTELAATQLVHASGGQLKGCIGTNIPFEFVFESVGKSRVLKFIDFCYSRLIFLWKKMFAYQFVVSMRPNSFEKE
jgi:glycosyltransferase involved in cell wall biosynthesis